MREPAMRKPTTYPVNLLQNMEDFHRPGLRQWQAMPRLSDPVRQGGGSRTERSTAQPAEKAAPARSPIDDRAPGSQEDLHAWSEAHWDAPLPVNVRLAPDWKEETPPEGPDERNRKAPGYGPALRTLRDARDFLAGRYMPLEPSTALQETTQAVMLAARTGAPDDLAHAALRLDAYIKSR